MIQAECTCGWTMAGPPADSWEIDQAVDEHDTWCPDNEDWVNDEIEQQADDRDRIIRAIRNTATCTGYGEYVIGLITKSDPSATPAKKSRTEAAPNPNPLEEVQDMYNTTTQSTAWHPLWCTECRGLDPDERHHRGNPISYTRPYTLEYGDLEVAARLQLWEFLDQDLQEPTTVEVTFNGGSARDLSLHDLDQVISVLSLARQQLIEVADD